MTRISRRDFAKASTLGLGFVSSRPASIGTGPAVIEPFDYDGVRLNPSRLLTQYEGAREFYLGLSDEDILHGFRKEVGLSAPGKPLGGWCRDTSATTFGQWLSGMSRMYRATGDTAMRDKARYLLAEWGKTVKADGDCRMRHYPFDKLVCGLVDMKHYADDENAIALLDKTAAWARRTLEHTDMVVVPSHNTIYYGRPQEWYTLSENLYRAYQVTGDNSYKSFAGIWHYPQYWNKFANTAVPTDPQGVHAYSHVNTFSGAAMAYEVTQDPTYLAIIKNAYDFLQNTQCYATGGYGPNERFMSSDGSLGRALETRSDTFETLCGSWAAFKLSRYLMRFTGEARYGDWIERLIYNGSGAALPLRPGGRNFYYSDYRTGGGMKVDYWENFTCCSGTYIQNVADYHNLIYYRDPASLYVNLYVPSHAKWNRPGGVVTVTLETSYPENPDVTLLLGLATSQKFALKFRVPAWSHDMSVAVNGAPVKARWKPGEWATIDRMWQNDDRVSITIPLHLRMEAVDRQHPWRVAIVRGPVVLTLDANYHDPAFQLPGHEEQLASWLVAPEEPTVFAVKRPDGRAVRLKFSPFYAQPEDFPYRMYFDLNEQPYGLW